MVLFFLEFKWEKAPPQSNISKATTENLVNGENPDDCDDNCDTESNFVPEIAEEQIDESETLEEISQDCAFLSNLEQIEKKNSSDDEFFGLCEDTSNAKKPNGFVAVLIDYSSESPVCCG